MFVPQLDQHHNAQPMNAFSRLHLPRLGANRIVKSTFAGNLRPHRRSNVPSIPNSTGASFAWKVVNRSVRSKRLTRKEDQATWFRTRWWVIKCESCPRPMARKALATVRRPDARNVPLMRSQAWSKVGRVKAGANTARSAKKDVGRVSLQVPPNGDVPSFSLPLLRKVPKSSHKRGGPTLCCQIDDRDAVAVAVKAATICPAKSAYTLAAKLM